MAAAPSRNFWIGGVIAAAVMSFVVLYGVFYTPSPEQVKQNAIRLLRERSPAWQGIVDSAMDNNHVIVEWLYDDGKRRYWIDCTGTRRWMLVSVYETPRQRERERVFQVECSSNGSKILEGSAHADADFLKARCQDVFEVMKLAYR